MAREMCYPIQLSALSTCPVQLVLADEAGRPREK